MTINSTWLGLKPYEYEISYWCVSRHRYSTIYRPNCPVRSHHTQVLFFLIALSSCPCLFGCSETPNIPWPGNKAIFRIWSLHYSILCSAALSKHTCWLNSVMRGVDATVTNSAIDSVVRSSVLSARLSSNFLKSTTPGQNHNKIHS